MKINIKEATALEPNKFYIFKVKKPHLCGAKQFLSNMHKLREQLWHAKIQGIIYDGEIEVVIPKQEN